MKLDEAKDFLLKEGIIDERKIFSCSNAQNLPDGSYGLVGIGFNKDKFIVCDVSPEGLTGIKPGKVLYEIPLSEVSDVKGSDFVLWRFVKFNWQGAKFCFKAFASNAGIISTLKGNNAYRATA